MDINLSHRPRGATHAGKEDGHGSWYKKNDAGNWMFIDMSEDGLADRQWNCIGVGVDPGYELIDLPIENQAANPEPKADRDDGNAAFPMPGSEQNQPWYGMSLRDYFAAKCSVEVYVPVDVFYRTYGRNPDASELAKLIAEIRFIEADAMLAARGET